MVGILLSYWGGLFSGATLVSGRVVVSGREEKKGLENLDFLCLFNPPCSIGKSSTQSGSIRGPHFPACYVSWSQNVSTKALKAVGFLCLFIRWFFYGFDSIRWDENHHEIHHRLGEYFWNFSKHRTSKSKKNCQIWPINCLRSMKFEAKIQKIHAGANAREQWAERTAISKIPKHDRQGWFGAELPLQVSTSTS